MRSPIYHVALEGPDGCGKSRQAEILTRSLLERYRDRGYVWPFAHVLPPEGNPGGAVGAAAHYAALRYGILSLTAQVPGDFLLLVSDRWTLSTVAFARSVGTSTEVEPILAAERAYERAIGLKTRTIFLTASDETLDRRLSERGEDLPAERLTRRAAYRALAREMDLPEIDTDRDREKVAAEILRTATATIDRWISERS